MSIMVIGDVIRDIYHYGKVRGVSAETPTLVMERHEKKIFDGGAALITRHLGNLLRFRDEDIYLVTLSERKWDAPDYAETVYHEGWTISTKERFFVDDYKLFQVDELNKGRHSGFSSSRDTLVEKVDDILCRDGVETIILSDNRHGVFDKQCVDMLLEMLRGRRVIVDTQVSQHETNIDWYLNNGAVSLFMMNEREFNSAASMLSLPLVTWEMSDGGYEDCLRKMAKKTKADVILKLGAMGSAAYIEGRFYRSEPCHEWEDEIVDTCGAGDAFLASYVANSVYKHPARYQISLDEANRYAAKSCTLVGTEVPII